MRLMNYRSMLALGALACMASDGADPGGSAGGGGAAAKPAETKSAEPKAGAAPKEPKTVHVVWCAPGYEGKRIGGVYKGPVEAASRLAKAGTVRAATADEIRAAKSDVGAF